ncbi:MAG: hypothetical protein KatS3mg102_1903 [Planctomycetota bacterium]|nr:MAG: hypothetical protein KatS3mg102_1903 [Planctomycetota bacterium]
MGPGLRARIRLLRLPLAATAMADVWVGWSVVHAPAGPLGAAAPPPAPGALLALLASALCLYGAGMTLNDAFDALRDRRLHPERPIPRGAIGRAAAFQQGGLLLAAGVGLAAVAGTQHLLLAAVLAGAILLYDGLLKRWAVPGAACMGAIRYLDVQLGAGFAAGPSLVPALVLGAYVACLTWLSTFEERPQDGRGLAAGIVLVLFVLMVGGLHFPHYLLAAWLYALVGGGCAFFGMRAVHLGSRAGVQQLTLALLLGMYGVHAGSLLGYGLLWPALAMPVLAASFPLLRWLLAPPAAGDGPPGGAGAPRAGRGTAEGAAPRPARSQLHDGGGQKRR